jgi:hypothetical protein
MMEYPPIAWICAYHTSIIQIPQGALAERYSFAAEMTSAEHENGK